MSIYVSLLTAGTNSHEETSENANAVATDFFSAGVVGPITNTSGVAPSTGAFAVNAQGTPDMTVAVSSGVAYVAGTPTSQNSQLLRVRNSASANVTISANSSGSTKYDFVYISLDASKLANPAVNADDVATLVTSRSSSSTSDNGTPPTYGLLLAVVTVANEASSIANGNIADSRANALLSASSRGWTYSSDTWTYSSYSSTNKTGVITVPTDATLVYSVGMRVRFYNNSSLQYGIITEVTSTALTVYFGTDYSLSNSAITQPSYSYQKAPFGFPLDPSKWTVTLSDTSARSQSSPTSGTWYNLGSLSLSIPIGAWKVSYRLFAVNTTTGAVTTTYAGMRSTLSTGASTESSSIFTVAQNRNNTTETDGTFVLPATDLNLSSATTYYLNAGASQANNALIRFDGTAYPTVVKAVSAYL